MRTIWSKQIITDQKAQCIGIPINGYCCVGYIDGCVPQPLYLGGQLIYPTVVVQLPFIGTSAKALQSIFSGLIDTRIKHNWINRYGLSHLHTVVHLNLNIIGIYKRYLVATARLGICNDANSLCRGQCLEIRECIDAISGANKTIAQAFCGYVTIGCRTCATIKNGVFRFVRQ